MGSTQALRDHLLYLLRGGAHLDFEKAIADLPAALRGGELFHHIQTRAMFLVTLFARGP